jgi:hypothetical protein
MAVAYKVLGQRDPAATTLEDAYTVPGGGVLSAIVSSITVCNRDAAATSYRIAVRPAGAAIATKHYIAYDAEILGNEFYVITLGLTIATTDVVSVYASLATLSFNVFGQENS